jgi:hypothetical protein
MGTTYALDFEGRRDVRSVIERALVDALKLTGAPFGNVQLMDWATRRLTIAAQHGFDAEFLNFFRAVRADDGSACGRALRERRSIIIEDVLTDAHFTPCQEIALRSGFRAVQSTPMVSSGGAFLGVLSTHYPASHRPLDSEMKIIASAAAVTADAIILIRAGGKRLIKCLKTVAWRSRVLTSCCAKRMHHLLGKVCRRRDRTHCKSATLCGVRNRIQTKRSSPTSPKRLTPRPADEGALRNRGGDNATVTATLFQNTGSSTSVGPLAS